MSRFFVIRVLGYMCVFGGAVHAQQRSFDTKAQIFVGILDDAREEMVNWKPGTPQERIIRPAFEKTAGSWKQVVPSSLPDHLTWTVAFDGRNLRRVESRSDVERTFQLTLAQRIVTAASAVPTVGSPSQAFAGIMGFGSTSEPQTRFRRPLVVVSDANFHDPDGWKRTKLTDELAASVRKAFRREYPHVDLCKDEQVIKRDWAFPDSALSFPVIYASNKNSFLVEANLNAGDCGWVDQPNDPESGPWFFVSGTGRIRRVGSFMSLLDAGDYDNDGKSEVIFFLSQGENTDGFVLFDASFENQVSLLWHYH